MVAALRNGGWRNWVLGIIATIVGSLVLNGITFQRDTREALARDSELIKILRERQDNLIKYFNERITDRTIQTDKELAALDARITRTLELLDLIDKKITSAPEIGRELRDRDAAILRMEKRVEDLERRGRSKAQN